MGVAGVSGRMLVSNIYRSRKRMRHVAHVKDEKEASYSGQARHLPLVLGPTRIYRLKNLMLDAHHTFVAVTKTQR